MFVVVVHTYARIKKYVEFMLVQPNLLDYEKTCAQCAHGQ